MKPNRLLLKLRDAEKKNEKIFSAFLTLGYPNLKTTEKLLNAFERTGVDTIELGFPFSDPLADGPTIQFSSQKALDGGISLDKAFHLVRRLRQRGNQLPIIFFTYFNPVLHYGIKRFIRSAKSSGYDGLLIPDLPPEEEKELTRECHRQRFPQIYLIAPTTRKQRAVQIARASQGFIYYVSLRGVTGARRFLPSDLKRHLRELKRVTSKPFLVGFGVSRPQQAAEVAKMCQGVIVGSAIIDQIRKAKGKTAPVVRFVSQMVKAVKAGR